MLQRLLAAAAWAMLAFIAYATLSPIELRPEITNPNLERFGAYAVLGLLLGIAYPRRLILIGISIVGIAGILEAAQLFEIDRHGHLRDALFKVGGGICGLLATRLFSLFAVKVRS